MDVPLDVGASGRSSASINWVFFNYPIDPADQTSGDFTTGLPGVTIDCRTSDQPQYSNDTSTSGIDTSLDVPSSTADSPSLGAPDSPTVFIYDSDLNSFFRFTPDDLPEGVGIWARFVCTGEKCAYPDGGRFIPCSPFFDANPLE